MSGGRSAIQGLHTPVRQAFLYGHTVCYHCDSNEQSIIIHCITMKTCRIPYENPAVLECASSVMSVQETLFLPEDSL